MYLLTIMCALTRYPEAIPLHKKINSPSIVKRGPSVKVLIKLFTVYILPKPEGGTVWSGIFPSVWNIETNYVTQLGIEQVVSSAWHPQSQGVLERYHQTMKTMFKCYWMDHEKDWDSLCAIWQYKYYSGVFSFSPAELVFGHCIRGSLNALSEQWL